MKKAIIILGAILGISWLVLIVPTMGSTGLGALWQYLLFYWVIAPLCFVTLVVVLVVAQVEQSGKTKRVAGSMGATAPSSFRSKATTVLLVAVACVVAYVGLSGVLGFLDNF